MKKKSFTESQIVAILKSQNSDKTVESICRDHGIATAPFYNWNRIAEAKQIWRYGKSRTQTYARVGVRKRTFKKVVGRQEH